MNNESVQTDLTASRYVTDILTEQKLGKVHSVFQNGFNVKVGDRLAFVGKGTRYVAAIGLNWANEAALDRVVAQLQAGTVIKFKETGMNIFGRGQSYMVEFTDLETRDLSLPTGWKLKEDQYDRLMGAFSRLNVYGSSGFNDGDRLKWLYQAFLEGQLSLEEMVESIIGLGVGLTPSGDDFIQGMMIVEQVFGDDHAVRDMLVDKLTLRSTTDVSLGYYQALVDGMAPNEVWLEFLKMLPDQSEDELFEQLRWMRRYGHTSGSDLLLGFETYLMKKQEDIIA